MTKRRLKIACARVLLPILTAWLAMLPGKSYALAPALIPLAGVFIEADAAAAGVAASIAIAEAATGASVGAASASVTSAASGAALAMIVGGAATYLAVNDTNGKKVRIPLVADPQKGAIPAPSASPTATQSPVQDETRVVYPTPAFYAAGGGNAACQQYGIYPPGGIDNWQAACTLQGGAFNPGNGQCTINSVNYSAGTCTIYQAASCPSGYVVSGSSCVLTDPRAATADNSLDYGRTGNAYSAPSATDADASQTLQGSLTQSGAVQIVGADTQGRPVYFDIAPRTDGGSTIKKRTQVSTVAGDTGIQTVTIDIAPSGVVEGASQATVAGQMNVTPGTTSGNATAASTTTQTVLDTQAQGQAVTFPNDYSRQGEAAAAANTLAPKLDTIGNALTQTSTVADPVEPVGADMPTFGNTFSSLLSWQLPSHSSACPSLTFDLSMISPGWSALHMDSHCSLIQGKTQEFAVAMTLVWTLLAMMIVLRA